MRTSLCVRSLPSFWNYSYLLSPFRSSAVTLVSLSKSINSSFKFWHMICMKLFSYRPTSRTQSKFLTSMDTSILIFEHNYSPKPSALQVSHPALSLNPPATCHTPPPSGQSPNHLPSSTRFSSLSRCSQHCPFRPHHIYPPIFRGACCGNRHARPRIQHFGAFQAIDGQS